MRVFKRICVCVQSGPRQKDRGSPKKIFGAIECQHFLLSWLFFSVILPFSIVLRVVGHMGLHNRYQSRQHDRRYMKPRMQSFH